MNLEDHLGDIIRKARGMSGISSNAAARAAGLSAQELASLEADGTFLKRPDFAALAKTIGLSADKLESVANGWSPAKTDLSAWKHLRVFTSSDDSLSVNCFLIWDESLKEAALFDTGFDEKSIFATLAEHNLTLRHIFITHSDYDHIDALGRIRAAKPEAAIHSNSSNAPARQRNQPGEIIALGDLKITHRATPGHADDGVTYFVGGWKNNAPSVAIVGDAIFAGSMGRGNDSWELARSKVREEILTLPAETLICPGHGPLTTVEQEREHNPFF